nr:serine/threonine-protein kinase atm [Quercus suber]
MLKHLEELRGSILFCGVACGVSLVALVAYCCHLLLPALVLHGDSSKLSWVAKVACQLLATLLKNHFVPIFAICVALHCSKESGWEKAAIVLQSSILHLAEKSRNEQDKLIEKHMVSIVSHILSLASLLCFRSPGPFIFQGYHCACGSNS